MGWFDDDRKVLAKLDIIIKQNGDLAKLLAQVLTQGTAIMVKVTEASAIAQRILDGVRDETTQLAGIKTVLVNLNKEIQDLKTQAADLDLPQDFIDKLNAIEATTGANRQEVIDDVAANTHAQPEPKPGA